jgi:hypothetical protein
VYCSSFSLHEDLIHCVSLAFFLKGSALPRHVSVPQHSWKRRP